VRGVARQTGGEASGNGKVRRVGIGNAVGLTSILYQWQFFCAAAAVAKMTTLQ